MPKIAEIIPFVRLPRTIDVFDYRVLPEQRKIIQEGSIVDIPLRKRKVLGFVSRLKDTSAVPVYKLRAVQMVLAGRILSPEQHQLLNWISEYYNVSRSVALKMFFQTTTRSFFQKAEARSPVRKKRKNLLTHPWLESSSTLVQYTHRANVLKTYQEIIQQALKASGQVLLLFPRIVLLKRFIEQLPEKARSQIVSFYASAGSSRSIQDAFWKIQTGKAKVILGTRSALFAPFTSLSAIIVDHEESSDHKQEEPNPRYFAMDVIRAMRTFSPQLRVVYTSPMPSLERWREASQQGLHRFIADSAFASSSDKVEILDIRHPESRHVSYPFHQRMEELIRDTVKDGRSVFLLVNRRGESSSLVCKDCGWSPHCPNCDLPLAVFDARTEKESLRCQHCGHIESGIPFCASCQGPHLRYQGVGIQKAYSAARKLFLDIPIHRIDRESGFHAFAHGKPSIIISTPVGLDHIDFSHIGLIGVLSIEGALFSPEFRSTEQFGQMLQRALTLAPSARMVIQTVAPEHTLFSMFHAGIQSYEEKELAERQKLGYPPFRSVIKLIIQNTSRVRAEKDAVDWVDAVDKEQHPHVAIDGPIRPLRSFIRGKNRVHILLRAKDEKSFEPLLRTVPQDWIIDKNPIFLL